VIDDVKYCILFAAVGNSHAQTQRGVVSHRGVWDAAAFRTAAL
jgi:hypothetical protein